MTSVAKKTRGREKPSPDVTAVPRPRRVNLGLTCPSHTHLTHAQTSTQTHTHRVQMFYKSPVTTLSYQFVFIYFFCQQKHWHDLRRAPLGWVHLHKLVYPYVHMQPSQKQGYKHNQMPLWLYTEVYSHTWKHTWGSHGTSELTNPFIREPTCSLVDFFFAPLCVLCHRLNFLTLFVHLNVFNSEILARCRADFCSWIRNSEIMK